jgi:hypothetical protein
MLGDEHQDICEMACADSMCTWNLLLSCLSSLHYVLFNWLNSIMHPIHSNFLLIKWRKCGKKYGTRRQYAVTESGAHGLSCWCTAELQFDALQVPLCFEHFAVKFVEFWI